MSLTSALLTATSGLRLTTKQLTQTSQNIANADVAGYTRKTVSGSTLTTGGVKAEAAQRTVDAALRNQALAARSADSAATLRNDTLSALSGLQGDTTDSTSTSALISALNDAFTELAASPSDSSLQSAVVDAASDVASNLNAVSDAITTARQSVQDGLVSDVDAANALVSTIGDYDQQIRAATAAGQSTADLKDKRDAAIAELSDYVAVKSTEGSDGGVTLTLGDGSVLPLDAEDGPFGLDSATITPSSYSGEPDGTLPGLTLNGQSIDGGSLGGSIGEGFTLRDETLPTMQAELDEVASTLAERLDAQGLRLFTDSDGSAPPDTSTSEGAAQAVGFASRITVNSAVEESPRLVRDGTHAVDGFTPNTEDGPSGFTTLLNNVTSYSFGTTSSDGTAYASVRTTGLGPGGNLTSSATSGNKSITDYATAVVSRQSSVAAAAESAADTAGTQRDYLDGLVSDSEGVDTDTELANMVTLQNAYAANAQVMSAVQSMWDALLDAVR
ncbi:flagellar hook-associated protein FlgK [Roseomonas sp. GC11]|uniref:flagellar hook-associated protein FlgK n=1 Tax=Roseomonas sp. GC11 TaxID=2950546 RepID=UPI00210926EE|nr:flagellar hook-associated protein FlgK [Roseomonas sp. GC11]MCQ4162282.1 flagellar hook-associated protein FlgK [Roseomonas sp. GC11]